MPDATLLTRKNGCLPRLDREAHLRASQINYSGLVVIQCFVIYCKVIEGFIVF